MKPFTRADRVSGLIRETLSDILRKEISDPRLEMAVITTVKMTRDLKLAKIYYSVSGGEQGIKKASEGFQSALGFIKRTLAREVELRYMPELHFYYDESFDYGSHIDELLKSIDAGNGTDPSQDKE